MRIRLKKLEELPDAMYPNNIEVGFEHEFEIKKESFVEPTVGERFYPSWWWSTSPVQEILSEKTFKTLSSVYEWEIINED